MEKAERLRRRREHELQNVFSRLHAAQSANRVQAQRLLRRVGEMSVLEWRTLWDLHDAGPLTVRDLADVQGADHSVISRVLPVMRAKALIEMRRDERDGRQTIVTMTETGRRAYEDAAPIMKQRRAAMRTQFSEEEIAELIRLLGRLEAFCNLPADEILVEETSTKGASAAEQRQAESRMKQRPAETILGEEPAE